MELRQVFARFGSCIAMRFCIAASLAAFSAAGSGALAQDGAETPSRSLQLIRAMDAAAFAQVEPGLSVLVAKDTAGTSVHAFRIDQKRFRFGIAVQDGPDGERVDVLGERAGAVLAVNGGFFGEKEFRKGLYPVGLLRIDDRDLSQNWKTTGGYLLFRPSGLSIAPSSAVAPPQTETVLQSKPLIIAPGGQWAMNTNQEISRPRTIVCLLPDGEAVVTVLSGFGLSLYEAGWLFRAPSQGGRFGCDSALALDGGGSTQLWVSGREDLSVSGETAVHNALVLRRK